MGAQETGFLDGLRSFVSTLVNRRDPINQNVPTAARVSDEALRAIYRSGLGNKIVRLKAGRALKDTLEFESTEDRLFYGRRLQRHVRESAKWMLAFGRGIVVIQHKGDDLAKPLTGVDPDRVQLRVFSGDMVHVTDVVLDLQDPRYYQPRMYNVRGTPIHHTRVVDFTYVEPPELDAPNYRYGGISEFELIYDQLIADGIVQRSSPRILEKASTLFYKVKGFKDAMRRGKEREMVDYFSRMEDVRGVMAAGLIDSEDELEVVQQTISNLAEADLITLRRLAMVTGIALTELVGEPAKGMNSSGENERAVTQDTIEALEHDYLLEPINQLMGRLGQGRVTFKENQGETPNDRIDYEKKAVEVAKGLAELGEDYVTYLTDKGLREKDEFDLIFSPPASFGAMEPEPDDATPADR